MPLRSTGSNPALRISANNSSGVMNLFQSWVPLGSQRNTHSAPIIAMPNDLIFRFKVEQIINPSDLSNSWHAVR